MTGNTYIKQAVISALCEHPHQEKYRTRAFAGDSLTSMTEALSGKGVALSKQDFFTPDENGVYLIDTPGFWRNFAKIRDMLARGGERFESEDFLFTLNAGARRTLLVSANENSALDQVFSEDNWRGRFEEMERLWYKAPMPGRRAFAGTDGTLPLHLKRRLYALEGRQTPEDRLAKAGLTPADLHAAFRERGDFESLKLRLSRAGDYLRKEYLLLCDGMGDTCMASQEAWNRYPQVAATLAARGEQLEVADFIRQVGQTNNVMARAADRRALDKVFAPGLWVNRLDDMTSLWGQMLPAWKISPMTPADFDHAYSQAESLTYAPTLDFTALHGKEDLLRPLNEGSSHPVLGLGLKAFWDDAALTVLPELAQNTTPLLVADLRRSSGQLGNSCLISAAKFGHFRTVVGIARVNGEALEIDDFLSRDSHGKTLLAILAERRELSLVFTPALWAGRVGDMKALWNQVRHADRAQVDMQKVEVATKQATLKKQSKGNFRIKPR